MHHKFDKIFWRIENETYLHALFVNSRSNEIVHFKHGTFELQSTNIIKGSHNWEEILYDNAIVEIRVNEESNIFIMFSDAALGVIMYCPYFDGAEVEVIQELNIYNKEDKEAYISFLEDYDSCDIELEIS